MANWAIRVFVLFLSALALTAGATEPEGGILFTTQGVVAPVESGVGLQPGERLFEFPAHELQETQP